MRSLRQSEQTVHPAFVRRIFLPSTRLCEARPVGPRRSAIARLERALEIRQRREARGEAQVSDGGIGDGQERSGKSQTQIAQIALERDACGLVEAFAEVVRREMRLCRHLR